jgi:hypothetical protein
MFAGPVRFLAEEQSMSVQPSGQIDSVPVPISTNATGQSPPSGLSAEQQEQRVARWERILKGEEEPDYLVAPPEVVNIIRGVEERFTSQQRKHLTVKARQRMLDDVTKQYYYGGYPVVVMETTRGDAVLAFGEEEIGLFYHRVSPSLRTKVVSEFPDPWW